MPQLDEKGTLDEQLLRHAYADRASRSRSLSGAARGAGANLETIWASLQEWLK